MHNKAKVSRFFLGANSPGGFFSRFDNLYKADKGWFCYILKGGPGTGKSGLMKKVGSAAIKRGFETELIYCSSDPSSLDAVIFPEIKCCIADGTSPHTLDPIYPGAGDTIVNLGEYWDSQTLFKSREDIIRLTKRNSLFHARSKGYLSAYGSVDKDTLKLLSDGINKEKALGYAKRLSKKLFKNKASEPGEEKIRFISGVTPDGVVFFEDTISNLCNQVYLIDDGYGAISGIILDYIRGFATNAGYDVITCFCPIFPETKPECLIFPELKICFVTSNLWHPLDKLSEISHKVGTRRFLDTNKISSHSKLISFNRKIERELLSEAIINLSKAKAVHDELERTYIKCMNFKGIDKVTGKMIKDILG